MKDPVCGMNVSEPPAIKVVRDGVLYGFCSEGCKAAFEKGGTPAAMDSQPKTGYAILAAVIAAINIFAIVGPGEFMTDFMGAFFLVFGAFKLLDLSGFADAFQTYDLIAKKFRAYAVVYPFIQLGFGAAYLTGFRPEVTNVLSLAVMSISALGVSRALLSKQKIKCACLGTRIQLPMSVISLVEDAAMAGMAAWMLFVR